MEQGPEFGVVGDVSSEDKVKVKEEINQYLVNHTETLSSEKKEDIRKAERQKTEKELALIDFANRETDKLMGELGVTPYDIPYNNYHMVSHEFFKEKIGSDHHAITFPSWQGIYFDESYFKDSPVFFGSIAFHETMHLKAYYAVEAKQGDEKVERRPYREGVSVLRPMYEYGFKTLNRKHFTGLHEAIVTEAQKRMIPSLFAQPELVKEKIWIESNEAKALMKDFAKKKGIEETDVYYIDQEQNSFLILSYRPQRKVLNYLCTEIQKQFPDRFKSSDDVFKVFLSANFTGNLLDIGRLVEKTFGEGSFRMLGNMDIDPGSAAMHLKSLEKAKMRQEKILDKSE